MSYGSDFILTLFTNDPVLAEHADRAGVNRIGPDLERIGKQERQGHLSTWISDHQENDLELIRKSLKSSLLFARTNPIHDSSKEEIDRLIAMGVQVLMLPMFTTPGEAARFIELVAGRAHPVLLAETAEAARRMDEIVRLSEVREIHIGLNDLRLSLGLKSHFQVLVSDLMDRLSGTIRNAGIRFGFGGIGRAGQNDLPIPADLVYAQYPRLGATAALVSRAFFSGVDPARLDLAAEIARARARLDEVQTLSPARLEAARRELERRVTSLPL